MSKQRINRTVSPDVQERFARTCKKMGQKQSNVIEKLMEDYNKNARKIIRSW